MNSISAKLPNLNIEETCAHHENKIIKILYVEDDPIDRRVVERILCPCVNPVQFILSPAENIAQAVEFLKKNEYDVVLLDLELPDSSGIEALQEISKVNSHVPVVVLTGMDDENTGFRAIENGATDYIVKELPLSTLLVRTILYAIHRKKVEEKAAVMARFPQENPNPVLRVSKDCIILNANNASSALLETWKCQVGDCIPEAFWEGLSGALRSGNNYTCEIESRGKRAFLATFVPVTEEGYVNVYAMDIMERKKAEDELKESENKFRTIFDNMPDGVILANVNTKRFDFSNKVFCEMVGYAPEEIKSLGIKDIHPENELPRVFELFDKLVKKEINSASDIPVKKRDGSVFYADISVFFMTFSQMEYAVGVFRDISERRQAEEAMQKSKKFIELVYNNMAEGISVIDVKDYRIIDANKAFLDFYGKDKDEVIGQTCFEITHKRSLPCAPSEHYCPIGDVLKSGKYSVTEHIHYTKDGTEQHVEVSAAPIKNNAGEVVQIIHMTKDITYRYKRTSGT